ncbi:unnamed protein product, partial [Staurois parvus]
TEPYKAACLQCKAYTQLSVNQHTVNPLVTPHVNPFLPFAIMLFFLALITVLVSLGMSVRPSQFPPVSECLPQSHYKSRITVITSKKKIFKSQYIYR